MRRHRKVHLQSAKYYLSQKELTTQLYCRRYQWLLSLHQGAGRNFRYHENWGFDYKCMLENVWCC